MNRRKDRNEIIFLALLASWEKPAAEALYFNYSKGQGALT